MVFFDPDSDGVAKCVRVGLMGCKEILKQDNGEYTAEFVDGRTINVGAIIYEVKK